MSARDDYPWPVGDHQQAIKQHGVMCREIDRLREETWTGWYCDTCESAPCRHVTAYEHARRTVKDSSSGSPPSAVTE